MSESESNPISTHTEQLRTGQPGEMFRIAGMNTAAQTSRLNIIRNKSEYLYRHAKHGNINDSKINELLRRQ
jgi:hypothetical protein